jgi:hypothetical protein
MDASIGSRGLALNPPILDSPILHGIAPEFSPDPDTVMGLIPLVDAF